MAILYWPSMYECFGSGTSMLSEAMAILSSLELAKELVVTFLWLELYSFELVNILQGHHRCPWKLYYTMENIRRFLSDYVVVISHVMREGNQGADGLANEAIRGEDSHVYRDPRDLPLELNEFCAWTEQEYLDLGQKNCKVFWLSHFWLNFLF